MTGVRKVYSNAAGQVWACYEATGGQCYRPEGETLCPHMPDYKSSLALREAAKIAPHADVGRAPIYTPELLLLSAAIVRTEREIAERFPFDPTEDACCRDCKWNGMPAYRALDLKLQRQEAWREVLLIKLETVPPFGDTPPGDKRSRFVRPYETYARLTLADVYP